MVDITYLYVVLTILLSLLQLHDCMLTNLVKCPLDCSGVFCNRYKYVKRTCTSGTVYDSCGCCQVCAKGADQLCGGIQDIYGKCGPGLYCDISKTISEMPIGNIGYCKVTPKHPVERSFAIRLHNSVDIECKPKCTADFCSKWPEAVCSSIDNVIISRTCQQPCQHTICNACYFKTKREPPCPKCTHDDFECLKAFSKCVKRDTCTRHKFPCESHQRRKSDGRFVCKVPACPSS